MHGYSRLNTSRSSVSLSPPASPRHRQLRSRTGSDSGNSSGGFSVRDSKQSSIMEKLVFLILSAVFRRKGLLLFAPLLYISMMLLYMGSLNFDVSISNLKTRVVSVSKRAPPGTVYRSPQVFEKLWPFMEAESRNSTTHAVFLCTLFCFLSFSPGSVVGMMISKFIENLLCQEVLSLFPSLHYLVSLYCFYEK